MGPTAIDIDRGPQRPTGSNKTPTGAHNHRQGATAIDIDRGSQTLPGGQTATITSICLEAATDSVYVTDS